LLYADDLAAIAETEEELIKRLNEWKDNVESKGMRVNMNKTKVMISGERQKVRQKAVRWPCGVCSKGVASNSIQCNNYVCMYAIFIRCDKRTSNNKQQTQEAESNNCQKWVHKKCSGIKGTMSKAAVIHLQRLFDPGN